MNPRETLYNFKQHWAGVLALAARVAKYRRAAGNDWREHARRAIRESGSQYNPWTESHGYKRCRWVEDTARAGLRFAGYVRPRRDRRDTAEYSNDSRWLFSADKDDGIGWYMDEDGFQDDILYAVVYHLPRGGFAYGYADAMNHGAAFLAFDMCADAGDAESRACDMAKRVAEEECEYRREQREAEEAAEEESVSELEECA